MAGAHTNIGVDRDIDRGLRSPRHLGLVSQLPQRFLRPFCVAPVRPGETLASVSIQGDMMFDSILQLNNRPMMYGETALWYVPMTVLPQWMQQIVISTPRDAATVATTNTFGGSAPVDNTAIGDQGHLSDGLQSRQRAWAGEIGGNQGTQDISSLYAPFTSHSTYRIATDWYDLDNIDWRDADMMQNEPIISEYIRGALISSFNASETLINREPSNPGATFADLVEGLMQLTRPETTWAEYLANHGVNPRNLDSMTHPIMIDHQAMLPMGTPHVLHQTNETSFDIDDSTSTSFTNTFQAEDHIVDPNELVSTWDARGVGAVGSRINRSGRPMLRFEQPGFIVGTHVWWGETGSDEDFGHHFDANRLVSPGHWGSRVAGGLDEEDFIATQNIYDPLGTSLQDGDEGNQDAETQVMSMLNLFLHGDVAAPGPNAWAFHRYRGPYGSEIPSGLVRCSGRLSTQFHIISDLVG